MKQDLQQVYTKEYYQIRAYESDNLREHFSLLASNIQHHFAPANTLDVGCARGFFVQALQDKGINARGMDVSRYAINNCAEGMRCYLQHGNAEKKFPYFANSFDVVTCMECIEHLETPELAIAEMRRVLRTGGYVLIASPKRTIWRGLFNLVYGQAEVHPSELSRAKWIALFRRHDMQYIGDFAKDWGIASELHRLTVERVYKMTPCTSTGRMLNRLGKRGRWLRVQLNVLAWEPEYMLFQLRP